MGEAFPLPPSGIRATSIFLFHLNLNGDPEKGVAVTIGCVGQGLFLFFEFSPPRAGKPYYPFYLLTSKIKKIIMTRKTSRGERSFFSQSPNLLPIYSPCHVKALKTHPSFHLACHLVSWDWCGSPGEYRETQCVQLVVQGWTRLSQGVKTIYIP